MSRYSHTQRRIASDVSTVKKDSVYRPRGLSPEDRAVLRKRAQKLAAKRVAIGTIAELLSVARPYAEALIEGRD